MTKNKIIIILNEFLDPSEQQLLLEADMMEARHVTPVSRCVD